MNSAPARTTRSLVALFLGAAMLVSTVAPFASVQAANEAGKPDDLVVLITPAFGTLLDDKIAVASSNNVFQFSFELFHADGTPFLVTEYAIDIHTIDGRLDETAAWPTLIWSDIFTTSATNKGTFLVPASEVVWFTPKDADGYHHEMPFGGMSVTFLARKGGSGESLLSPEFHYPAGSYNVGTAALVARGAFKEADQADEAPSPVLLFNGQLSGLVQFGNPILNPGFEVGGNDQDLPSPPACNCPSSSAIPPWFMLTVSGAPPVSSHHIQGAAGSSGSAVSIRYNPADNANDPFFGQLFFIPGADQTGAWTGTQSVKLEFDAKLSDAAGLVTSYPLSATLHWNDSTQSDGESSLNVATGGVSGGWKHYTIDFGAVANGATLNSVFFSFLPDTPSGSQMVLTLDNVRITGAKIASTVQPRQDSTDGFSAFVFPTQLQAAAPGGQAVQQLVQLADGKTAYVFRTAAVDYTGIDPKIVDVPGQTYSVFQILDESFIPRFLQGCSTNCSDETNTPFFAVTDGTNGAAFKTFRGPDGLPAKEHLVVVPASLAGKRVVPHLYVDVATGDEYEGVFGMTQPAHGFYSAARNNLMFTHLADLIDYSFTPIQLTNTVGRSMVAPTTIELTCPDMSPTVSCAADPDPDLEVLVATKSVVDETLTVEILSPALNQVLASGTVATPGGVVPLTISAASMDAMRAAGDLRVQARVGGGLFAASAQTGLFELDNFAPDAQLVSSSLTGLVAGKRVSFQSLSTDSDGTIARTTLKIDHISDPTPDQDGLPFNTRAATSQTRLDYTIENDGLFRATLVVEDNGGATDTVTIDFTVGNIAPKASVLGPVYGRPGQTLTFTYSLSDADGIVASHTVDTGSGPVERTSVAPILVSFATAGTHTVTVVATDDDGATVSASRSVLIDGDVPTTTLTVPDAPTGTGGWFTSPVDIGVARSDTGGSGVLYTQFGVNGVNETVPGSSAFTRTISADGVHVVKAFSVDRAGNSGLADAPSATIKIDRSKPLVRIVSPTLVDGAPISGVFLTDEAVTIVAAASDPQAPIKQVEFFVDGGSSIGVVTTPNADGTYSMTWHAAGTGFHEITVLATNLAGLSTLSETETILVV